MFIELEDKLQEKKRLINVNAIEQVATSPNGAVIYLPDNAELNCAESYETVKEMIGYKDFIVTAETVRVHKHLTERHEKKNARRLTLNDSEHDPDHDLQ